MLKKILQPKTLAIIIIVSMAIYSVVTISRGYAVVFSLLSLLLNPSFYIMIYLLIILLAKRKNVKNLNLLLIIFLSIYLVLGLLSLIMGGFGVVEILTFLTYSLLLFMVIGIFIKKKLPYKLIMISDVCLLIIQVIVILCKLLPYGDAYLLLRYLFAYFSYIIGFCSFILFIYKYGNSINQRSGNNE